MKRSACLIVLLVPFLLFGQKIRGVVKDTNNKPLHYVYISIKDHFSRHNESLITDSIGTFSSSEISANDEYELTFSLIGFQTKRINIKPNDDRNITIVLSENTKQLNEVTVNGRKNLIERKIDRLVFNVENNINTIGFDGYDLLGKTPMVKVEDNSISLIGKQGVAIMVDNKLIRLSGAPLTDFLKSIKASSIAKIEVITNPPAEYDAEGNSGIINIVTKKLKEPGYLVSLSQRAGKTTYYSTATGLNINYNVKKLLMFANLNGGIGANGPTTSVSRFYQNQTWDQLYQMKEKSKYLSGAIGFDYSLSKTSSIGLSYNANISYPDMISDSKIRISDKKTSTLDSVIHAKVYGDKKFNTKAFNVHYSKVLDSLGRDIQFDADYFDSKTGIDNKSVNYNTFDDYRLTNLPVNQINSGNLLLSKGYTLNLVMHLPTRKIKYTFGAKASFLNSDNNIRFNQSYSVSSLPEILYENQFLFSENTQAIFGSMNASLGRFKIQLGLRTEATQTVGESPMLSQLNKNSYVGFFPTFYLTYPASKKDVLSISYGRRIGRPNFSSLNPFKIYFNQYEYSTGNPYLTPSFTDNFELSNTYNSIFSTSLSYSISHDLPTSIQVISDGSNNLASTVGNFLNAQNFYLSNDVSVTPFSWLESYAQLSVYYSITKSSSPLTKQRVSGYGSDFRVTNSLTLNKSKTLTGGIDFTYQFPETSGIYRNYRYCYFDLSVSSSFFKKNLQLSFAARDIFKTKYVSSYTVFNNIGVYNRSNNDSRRLIVNLRYSFGNTKMSKGQNHISSGSEQVRSGN